MNDTTRCPSCRTLYRLTSKQIGWSDRPLRCRCGHVWTHAWERILYTIQLESKPWEKLEKWMDDNGICWQEVNIPYPQNPSDGEEELILMEEWEVMLSGIPKRKKYQFIDREDLVLVKLTWF